MKGQIDVLGALCTTQCAKYYKRFNKIINSVEKVDSNKVKAFDDWMED